MNSISNTDIRKIKADKVDKLLQFIIDNGYTDEDWKELYWGDEQYFISSCGRVISLSQNNPRLLKPFVCNGYYYVSLFGHDRRINRLVAQTFIDNPEGKKIAHHKDEDKLNNNIDNLLWATHQENTQAYYDNRKKKEE